MTKQDVIKWLRAEAQKLLDAAASLEGEETSSGSNGAHRPPGSVEFRIRRPFNLEIFRNRLKEKNGRVSDVAKHFGVSPEEVNALIQEPSSGIKVGDRGWLILT